jgi:4-amino-4-deoxy-L-arabinose transferase-like glycosyltransferase
LLLYGVGRRLFGREVGLVAAALAAVTPWHLFLSRWGHESGLIPVLTVAPIAALFWAGFPLGDRPCGEPRFFRAVVAGALTGVCCYGYGTVRVFLPILMLGLIAVNGRRWWALTENPRGRAAAAGLVLGLAITFGPLAHAHLTDPEMNKRATGLALWSPSDATATKALKVLERYVGHFGPDFLFVRGDVYPLHQLPGSGPLPWAVSPLLVAGLAAALLESRRSASARSILAWVAIYPVGDIFWKHPSLHLLRSAPGICCLLLLAALGATRAVGWLTRRSRRTGWIAGLLLALAVAVAAGRFTFVFFGDFNRRWDTYQMFNADLLEASRWVRPKLDQVDAVVISGESSAAMEEPFVVVLVGLAYDPDRWFSDAVEVERRPGLDLYRRFGKVRFIFDDADRDAVRSLRNNGRPDRVLLVLRPGEWSGQTPVHEIRLPDGRPTFLIYDEVM